MLCILAVSIGLVACGPQVERSIGKNKTGLETSLNAHLISVVPISEKVSVITDGSLGVRDSAGVWQKEFVLGKGEKFMMQPDEHASASFEVVGIKPDSVSLKYVSQFDHRSFGKNLIATDEGEIEVSFTSKQ
jgi:hypothetical protein